VECLARGVGFLSPDFELRRGQLPSNREGVRDLAEFVVRRLYGASIQLHTALGFVTDAEARQQVERTLEELDRIVNEVRSRVFSEFEDGTPEQS
jgi:hypothetical protein